MDTKKLRQKILDLAIHGKLVPQDPNDEPASVLLERIRAEKEALIKEGKIKRMKKTTTSDTPHYENVPFDVPDGWSWCTISDICSKIGSGSTPRGSNYAEAGIPFFRSQNVYNDGLVYEDIKYIAEDVHKSMIGTEVLPKDLLLNITGGSLGRCAIVPNDFERGNVSQHVCILRTVQILPEYLHCFIISDYFSETMILSGSGREGLPKYSLEAMMLPIPPLSEQRRIVTSIGRWLSIADILDDNTEQVSKAVESAKAKILDLAIHGKLVPQDLTDEPASELLKRINPKVNISCDNPHYEQVPTGWCFCSLEDIVDYEQPQAYIVESTDYSELYDIPVLTAGKSFIIGHTHEQDGVCRDVPVIIFDDFTTDSKYVDFPFKVKSSAMKILHVKRGINVKYVAYFMSVTRLIGETHKRYWISEYSKVIIPLPPKEEQDRIIDMIELLSSSLDSIAETLA